MTTICWDGETLAADKQSTIGLAPVETRKAHRVSRNGSQVLFGCAGNSYECYAFRKWATGQIEKPQFKDISLICVDHDRQVWIADESLIWLPISAKQWGIGSGSEYALGAMAAGSTATQAIRIASKLDVHSGLGVDVVRFSDPP